jgi:hypothetical protein
LKWGDVQKERIYKRRKSGISNIEPLNFACPELAEGNVEMGR